MMPDPALHLSPDELRWLVRRGLRFIPERRS